MEMKVLPVLVNLNWQLMNTISQIDRFDASWTSIEKVEGQTLKELKSIARVRSVGASTRIEGSRMNDEEVEVLLDDITIDKMDDRDTQEVAGYYETLDLIAENHAGIGISENELKALHKKLMSYSEKDSWHRGDYKQQSNSVEATHVDGRKELVFETALPGIETEDAMRRLVQWYMEDRETHALGIIQQQLMNKLEMRGLHSQLSPREKSILTFVGNHPGCKSGDIARRLGIPSSTVKRVLPGLLAKKLLARHGTGPGTNYSLL